MPKRKVANMKPPGGGLEAGAWSLRPKTSSVRPRFWANRENPVTDVRPSNRAVVGAFTGYGRLVRRFVAGIFQLKGDEICRGIAIAGGDRGQGVVEGFRRLRPGDGQLEMLVGRGRVWQQ